MLDVLKTLMGYIRDNFLSLLFDNGRLLCCILFNANNFIELVNRGNCGILDTLKHFAQISRGFIIEPKISIDNISRLTDQIDIEVGVGILFVDQVQHFKALSHPTNDFPVTDLVEE